MALLMIGHAAAKPYTANPRPGRLLTAENSPVGRPRNWNNNNFLRNFPLFGKLTSLAFRDFFKMSPEVVVQRFFCLDYNHFVTKV
jgi:hypothetical protein